MRFLQDSKFAPKARATKRLEGIFVFPRIMSTRSNFSQKDTRLRETPEGAVFDSKRAIFWRGKFQRAGSRNTL